MKKKKIYIIALVVAIVLFASLLSGEREYQKPISKFVEGLCEADGKQFVSSFSDAFIQEEIADRGCRNKAELTKKIQDNLDDFVDDYNRKLGKKWNYQYKVLYISEYDNQMDVEVEVELKGKKNSETVAFIFVLVKDGNKWLIDYYF